MDASLVIAIVGVAVGIAIGVPLLRTKSLASTIDLQAKQLDIERTERHQQERRCREDIAEVRGQLAVVTRDFAKVIAAEVIGFLREGEERTTTTTTRKTRPAAPVDTPESDDTFPVAII